MPFPLPQEPPTSRLTAGYLVPKDPDAPDFLLFEVSAMCLSVIGTLLLNPVLAAVFTDPSTLSSASYTVSWQPGFERSCTFSRNSLPVGGSYTPAKRSILLSPFRSFPRHLRRLLSHGTIPRSLQTSLTGRSVASSRTHPWWVDFDQYVRPTFGGHDYALNIPRII